MNLAEIVTQLERLRDDLTIYAVADPEWSPVSEAILSIPPKDGRPPTEALVRGMKYFLEVRLAKEVLEVWSDWRGGKVPSLEEKLEALVYYATNDAYLVSERPNS